jgi:hypothetical protein
VTGAVTRRGLGGHRATVNIDRLGYVYDSTAVRTMKFMTEAA